MAKWYEQVDNRKNEVVLRRFAAVSFIEQKVREGFGIVEALRLAGLRPWPYEKGQYWAARTLEDYGYGWKRAGFAAFQPKSRGDEGHFANKAIVNRAAFDIGQMTGAKAIRQR